MRQQWSGKKSWSILGQACDKASSESSSSLYPDDDDPEEDEEADERVGETGLTPVGEVGLSEAGFEMVTGKRGDNVGGGRTLFLRTTHGCSQSVVSHGVIDLIPAPAAAGATTPFSPLPSRELLFVWNGIKGGEDGDSDDEHDGEGKKTDVS